MLKTICIILILSAIAVAVIYRIMYENYVKKLTGYELRDFMLLGKSPLRLKVLYVITMIMTAFAVMAAALILILTFTG